MSLKLALVVDKSDAYIAFQKGRVLEEWGVEASELKNIGRLAEAGGMTLFGGGTASILTLDDADAVKQLATELAEESDLVSRVGSGLLILSSVDRRTTKKLETTVADLGGRVYVVKDSKDKQSNSEKLVSELHLNRSARDFLLAYVGEDYEALVPLVKAISPLAPQHQAAITEEDLFIRLPQAPGAVAPWALEKPLFAGNFNETIDIFRRVSKSSHFLVVLAVLRNKIQLAYRVAALQEAHGALNSAKLAKYLNVPDNYPLKLAMGYSKKYGLARLQKATEEMARTEAAVKGGSGANPAVAMELMLVRVSETLRA